VEAQAGGERRTIRALRHAFGWTQFELAVKVGVRPTTVYLWESGRAVPHVVQLRTLGKLFGLCSDDITLVSRTHLHRAPHQARAGRSSGVVGTGRTPRPEDV
jgi:DNA-binding XRE family transcriptional regulator